MRRKYFYWVILSLCVTVESFAGTASVSDGQTVTVKDAVENFEQGSRASKNGISVVNLHGTWHDMGRQYGVLLKKELGDVHQFIHNLIDSRTVNPELVEAVVDKEERQTPYRILEFMRGASETSGLTLRELQEANAVERISGLPQCSAAFCWGDYAAGPLVVGRNYDYGSPFSQLKDDVAVTVYHPNDGSLAVATIGYVGEIYSVNALNEKGIFLELNNGSPSARINTPAPRVTGTTMLFAALFETDELADWELFFNTTACSSSYIINMADSQKAVSYEWCQVGVKHGDGILPEGLMVSTNYFVNPDWLFVQPTDAQCWNGITRRNNLISLCETSKGSVDVEKMKEIIATKLEEGGAMNPMTVFQMVVTPESKSLWLRVTGGEESWLQVDLAGFLQGGTTGIAQVRSRQLSQALTIRPVAGGRVRLDFNQTPLKVLNVTVYTLAGTKLTEQTISPTGDTFYTIDVPQIRRGAYVIRVDSEEPGMSGAEMIRW
ncbi:MAG: hypothetical protein K5764_07240 [Prevotella sp.]|nr:hypothetical protein [Prevotella sp.]